MRNPTVATFGGDRLAPRCACETEAAARREGPVAASPLCVKRRSNVPQRYMSRPALLHIENELQFNNKRRRFQQVVFGSWPRVLSNAETRTETG